MGKEKALDNKVLDFLESVGAWRLKYWGGAKYAKSGIPDILACIDGWFFGIEDKAPNGKPSMLQLKNLEWIRNAGGYGILLYPGDFEIFKKFVCGNIIKDKQYSYEADRWYEKNIELQNNWQIKLKNV